MDANQYLKEYNTEMYNNVTRRVINTALGFRGAEADTIQPVAIEFVDELMLNIKKVADKYQVTSKSGLASVITGIGYRIK